MVCSKCGANIPDDSKFCVRCGNKIEKTVAVQALEQPVAGNTAPQQENKCPGCGVILKPGAKFCTKCGMKQEAPKPVQQPVQQEAPKPAQQEAPKPAQQPVQQAAPKPVQQPVQQEAPKPAQQPVQQAAPKPVQQPVQQAAPKPAQQPVQQEAPKPTQQPVQQAAPKPVQQTAAQPAPVKKKKKTALVVMVVLLLVIGVMAGACYYFVGVRGINPLEMVAGLSGSERGERDGDRDDKSNASEDSSQEETEDAKGDVTLLAPAEELAAQAKEQYEAGNYADGAIPLSREAIDRYITVAEENNLKEEAQEGIDSIYWVYIDALIRYSDSMQSQGAYAAAFEQISDMLAEATSLIETLTEKGYSVDRQELDAYRESTTQTFRDMYIESINRITEYENWSRDEAWNYAEQAYSIKENGKPILFDDQELEDPLRMRYVYCLAWITRKRCETGLADGSLSYGDAVQTMEAILRETDYNLLLIQDIITYGSSAGMDVDKYRQAYNAIVDTIKSEQGLTIGNDINVRSASSVDLRHFWYFNDLDGEDKYKVDTHNGTKASTREWIRSNVPVILSE